MNNLLKISLLSLGICLFTCACNRPDTVRNDEQEIEILTIHSDGKMVFKDKVMPHEDVIIYADGRGGEKAAVKMYVPFHKPFYRDSIVVERIEEDNGS